jgi:prepilin-type N-terminal cleavage/methylation domain-containing protein
MSRFSDIQVNLIHHAQQLMQQPAARRSASFAGTSIGFTIVELLIVIVVIGILAAIVIVAYNGIQNSANATAIADSFKKFDKAMTLYVTKEGYSAWPLEGDLAGGRLTDMISSVSGLKDYMQSAPNVAGISPTAWRYDYDGDVYNGCSASASGASLYVAGLTDQDMAQRVDDILDDGNLSCGKVRWHTSSNLMYSVSNDGSL